MRKLTITPAPLGEALPALIRLRWFAVALFSVASLLLAKLIGQPMVVFGTVAVVSLAVLSNAWLVRVHRRRQKFSTGMLAAVVNLDVGLLTLLLALSGGPSNPFSILYVVYVALAATLLRPVWMWTTAAVASIAFASLFLWHKPLPSALGGTHGVHNGYSLHLQGMWVAFVIAAAGIVAFVSRLSAALRREEQQRARTAELLGLATLAAGAAHEIGNPLATIRIAVDEVKRECMGLGASKETLMELNLISDEVARAKSVLDRMTAGATQLNSDRGVKRRVEDIVGSVLDDLGHEARARVRFHIVSQVPQVWWPQEAAGQILLQILRNALQASTEAIELNCHAENDWICLAVVDRGPGMPSQVMAKSTEPFFTTRPEEGMGLGLFIARSLVEHLGGRIEISSAREKGTRVEVWLRGSEERERLGLVES